MKSSFNFISATAKSIECILKTMFEFVLTKVTQPKSQSSKQVYPYRVATSKNTVGLMNLRIFHLKMLSVSELRMLESSLFHPIMVDGKYEFSKNWCFTMVQGILSAFLVLYGPFDCGIISKRYFGFWFLYALKKRHSFLSQHLC